MNTLKNMRVFQRIVELGSFTAAAESLDSAVSAMSRSVSELEDHLRTRLLTRSTRRIALTPTGARYLRRCQQILADLDMAEEEASGALERAAGTLRIRSFASIGQHYVLPAISKYRSQYPNVSMEVVFSQNALNLVVGDSDVAIVVAPSLSDSDMVSHLLGSTYSVLCASPHYLRSRGMPAQPCELAQHECLTLSMPAFPTHEWLLEGPGGSETVHVRGPVQVNIAESLVTAIREGMGIGVVPLYAAIEGLLDGTLVRVLPGFSLLNMNIYALYPSRKFIDTKTRTWVDFLRTYLPVVLARDEALLTSIRGRIADGSFKSEARH
jgi:DNA-binding transcriptional LysR family regulator